jgi:hypothetical protein
LIDIKNPTDKNRRQRNFSKKEEEKEEEKNDKCGRVYSLLMKDAEHVTIDIIRANNQGSPGRQSLSGFACPKVNRNV